MNVLIITLSIWPVDFTEKRLHTNFIKWPHISLLWDLQPDIFFITLSTITQKWSSKMSFNSPHLNIIIVSSRVFRFKWTLPNSMAKPLTWVCTRPQGNMKKKRDVSNLKCWHATLWWKSFWLCCPVFRGWHATHCTCLAANESSTGLKQTALPALDSQSVISHEIRETTRKHELD